MALELTTEEKQLLQADVLWEDTSTNPNLTSSSIPSKNKAFKTTNKRTIGAVNELKESIDKIQKTVDINISSFIEVLGDYNLDPSLKEDLTNIAPSILEAIKVMYDEIQLLKQNSGSGGTTEVVKFYTINMLYSEGNLYNLHHTNIPENGDFELTINGIEALECTDYRVDRENGILYWEDTASYELAEGDRIVAQYYISSTTQEKPPVL